MFDMQKIFIHSVLGFYTWDDKRMKFIAVKFEMKNVVFTFQGQQFCDFRVSSIPHMPHYGSI